MALLVSTTPADIAVYLGREVADMSTLETAQLQRWIDDATLIIEQRIGDLTPAADVLDYVVRQAVLAVAQAPTQGVASETVQIDDGSVTQRFDRTPRRVTILPEWWEMLGVTTGGGAFGIDMTPTDLSIHALWCDLYFGGTTCSCGAWLAGYPIFEQS